MKDYKKELVRALIVLTFLVILTYVGHGLEVTFTDAWAVWAILGMVRMTLDTISELVDWVRKKWFPAKDYERLFDYEFQGAQFSLPWYVTVYMVEKDDRVKEVPMILSLN